LQGINMSDSEEKGGCGGVETGAQPKAPAAADMAQESTAASLIDNPYKGLSPAEIQKRAEDSMEALAWTKDTLTPTPAAAVCVQAEKPLARQKPSACSAGGGGGAGGEAHTAHSVQGGDGGIGGDAHTAHSVQGGDGVCGVDVAGAGITAATAYMRACGGANAPNAEQERIIKDYFSGGEPKQMLVIGPPGSGKSTLFQALVRGVVAEGRQPVLVAEYNPQVHDLNDGLREFAHGRNAVRARTRAGLFALPEQGPLDVEELRAELSASAEQLLQNGTDLLEDEYALDQAPRMDACNAVCKSVRNDDREWGGMNNIKFGDPLQGDPIVHDSDLDTIPGSDVQARVTITSEGLWRRSPGIQVYVLTERVRFTELVLIEGHMQIACGPMALGEQAEQLRAVATAKTFADDTYVHTATGNNKRAMEIHNDKAWRRAAHRGMSVANGGVVHYKDENALSMKASGSYTADDLRKMRGYGYEEQVFVKDELYLVSVKERDPSATAPALTVGGHGWRRRRAVTNLEVATLKAFEFDSAGVLHALVMHIKGTDDPQRVPIYRAQRQFGHVVVESFPVRPFYERFAKLYQGLQFDEFHVDTAGWNPNAWGLLGMAVSRVKRLSGLKLSGVGTAAWLQKKATANWKVVLEVSEYLEVKPAAKAWAERCRELWCEAWAREDARRAARMR